MLRESLSSLESLGYVEARLGQGRFVADPEGWQGGRPIDDWLRRHESELRDLIGLRAVIESRPPRGATDDPGEMAVAARELLRAETKALDEDRLDDAAESAGTPDRRRPSPTDRA